LQAIGVPIQKGKQTADIYPLCKRKTTTSVKADTVEQVQKLDYYAKIKGFVSNNKKSKKIKKNKKK